MFEWWIYNWPSADSMRIDARIDACTILIAIVGRVNYTSAVLHGYVWSGGVQGNNNEGELVVSLTYHRSTAEKIDFDKANYHCPDKIYELADQSFIASDFR